MAQISVQHVEYIRKDLIRQDIHYSHLIDDLLDHICCDIEFEIDRGIGFEEAYANVKKWMGKNRCRKIQEETLLLTNKTYRNMKSIMKIFGIISPILMTIAALFRLQHWPGGGILLTFSFFLLCVFFLPSAIYVLYKENKGKRFVLYLAGFVSFFLYMAGILFKIMHWPGAGYLVLIAILAPFLIFLPAYLRYYSKSSNKNIIHLIAVLFLLSFVALMSALLTLSVSKNIIDYAILVNQSTSRITNSFEPESLNKTKGLVHENPSLATQQLLNLQKMTKDLCNEIDHLKFELLKAGDQKNIKELRDISKLNEFRLKGLYNEGIPVEILLHTDKAILLKQELTAYKRFVQEIFPEFLSLNPDVLLNLEDRSVHDEQVSWECYHFQGTPMIWSIQELDLIKLKLRLIENSIFARYDESNSGV